MVVVSGRVYHMGILTQGDRPLGTSTRLVLATCFTRLPMARSGESCFQGKCKGTVPQVGIVKLMMLIYN